MVLADQSSSDLAKTRHEKYAEHHCLINGRLRLPPNSAVRLGRKGDCLFSLALVVALDTSNIVNKASSHITRATEANGNIVPIGKSEKKTTPALRTKIS